MSEFDREKIWELAEAACEGDLSPTQRAELERWLADSAQARREFLHYVHLHGELYWQLGSYPGSSSGREIALTSELQRSRVEPAARWYHAGLVAACATLVAVVLAAFAAIGIRIIRWPGAQPEKPAVIAWVVEKWQLGSRGLEDTAAPILGTVDGKLFRGTSLALADEAVRLSFASGAVVLLEGPALVHLEDADRLRLERGALTILTGGGKKTPFRVETPLAEVSNVGTHFGVWTDGSSLEVHVFDGLVRLCPRRLTKVPRTSHGEFDPTAVAAGHAVRLAKTEGRVRVEPRAAQPGRFLHPGPEQGGVAEWRKAVASDPALAHLWSFEGWTPEAKLRDSRGVLHLREVVMFDGSGGSGPEYYEPGVDPSGRAVRIARGKVSGNSRGIAFQTGDPFLPEEGLTLEAIVRFDRPATVEAETLCVFLGTRQDVRRCGFLLAADGLGQLGIVFDADHPWLELPLRLTSGQWYYLAITYRKEARHGTLGTVVDAYGAALGEKPPRLTTLVKSAWLPGWIPPGHLGVGKGFEKNLAHAYPWSGAVDEIAIFREVLPEAAIKQHFRALTGMTAEY